MIGKNSWKLVVVERYILREAFRLLKKAKKVKTKSNKKSIKKLKQILQKII